MCFGLRVETEPPPRIRVDDRPIIAPFHLPNDIISRHFAHFKTLLHVSKR